MFTKKKKNNYKEQNLEVENNHSEYYIHTYIHITVSTQ